MDSDQLISIITINFNNNKGLLKTIQSVIHQTRKAFEYIVVDGGSTDNSIDVIKQNEQSIDIWLSEKDNGIYDAINKGIQKANGEYLLFLNSGDCLHNKNVVTLYSEYISTYKNTDIFYGDIYSIKENHRKLYKHPADLSIEFFKKNNINHQASLIKASLFKEFGLYPQKYKLASDHWLYLISFVAGKTFTHINQVLIDYDATGISVKHRNLYKEEVQKIWQEVVPHYVDKLILKYQDVEQLSKFKVFKIIVPLLNIYIYKKKIVLLMFAFVIMLILLMMYR